MMLPAINKAKHYGPIALKVLILGLTFAFILNKIASAEVQWFAFWETVNSPKLWYAPLFLFLAALNWCLEIAKWKILASEVRPLTMGEAARQSMAAFSAAAISPNRTGEYFLKGLYFRHNQRKKIALLKLHANLSQLLITILLGVPGLIAVVSSYKPVMASHSVFWLVVGFCGLLIAAYMFRSTRIFVRDLTLSRVWNFYRGLPRPLHFKVTGLSLLRYFMFGTLFLSLFYLFGGDIALHRALPLLTAMYLLASVLPTFVLLDFVIKGGVGVWLFSLAGVSQWVLINAVFGMWLLNFALPALVGAYFVARFKPVTR